MPGIDAARFAATGKDQGAAARFDRAKEKHHQWVNQEKLEGRRPPLLPLRVGKMPVWFEWDGMVSGVPLQELLPFRANAILW